MRFKLDDGTRVELMYGDLERIHNLYLQNRCEAVIDNELSDVSTKADQYTDEIKKDLAERMVNDINSQIDGDLMAMSFNDRVAEMDEEIGSLASVLSAAKLKQSAQNVNPFDQIKNAAKENGWHVYSDDYNEVEFSTLSPLNYEYSFTVSFDDAADIINGVEEIQDSFDIDNCVEEWQERYSKSETSSPSALVDDAREIKGMLEDLSDGLRGLDLNMDYDEEEIEADIDEEER